MRFRTTVIFWGSGLRPHQWEWSSTKRVSTGIRLFVFSKESCSAFGDACQENQWYFLICFREVTTTVEFRSKELSSVKVLLIHRWPRDVYVDPYQLASLSDQNNWKVRCRATRYSITQCKILLQTTVMYKTCIVYIYFLFNYFCVKLCKILLDSAIDLEVPAHKASGFVTYVYPFSTGPTSKLFKVTIPIHGRYHKPSFDGKMLKSVDIEIPELLLRSEKCKWIHFIL